MAVDERLQFPSSEAADYFLDKQLEAAALDFVLSEPQVLTPNPEIVSGDDTDETPFRFVLGGETLAAKALAVSDGDPAAAGAKLGSILANLPASADDWNTQSVRFYHAGSPYADAVTSLFGAAGQNVAIAESFCARAHDAGVTKSVSDYIAGASIIEALHPESANPEAGDVVIRVLADRMSDSSWRNVVENYVDSPAHTSSDEAYLRKATEVVSFLERLEQNEKLSELIQDYVHRERVRMLDVYTDNVFAHVAHEAWNSIGTEAEYARFITTWQLGKYKQLSVGLALALELSVNSWYLQLPGGPKDALLAGQVVARQDEILDLLSISKDDDPHAARPELPRYLNSMVTVELARRRSATSPKPSAK